MRSTTLLALGLVLAASAAAPLQAQTTRRSDFPQPAASAPVPAPDAAGPRMRGGMGMHGRSGAPYTPGWSLMTPEERTAHREAMRGATTREQCLQLMQEHRALMQQRAVERGVKLNRPARDGCRGFGRG